MFKGLTASVGPKASLMGAPKPALTLSLCPFSENYSSSPPTAEATSSARA